MSPEILSKKPFNAKANDIWCLGICCFMMIIGGCPWDKATKDEQQFNLMMNGEIIEILKYWQKVDCVNNDIIHLFSLFFKYEKDRATLDDIKSCKWLKENKINDHDNNDDNHHIKNDKITPK